MKKGLSLSESIFWGFKKKKRDLRHHLKESYTRKSRLREVKGLVKISHFSRGRAGSRRQLGVRTEVRVSQGRTAGGSSVFCDFHHWVPLKWK